MEITLAITILAALTAVIAAVGVFTSRSMLTRHAINASWLGLVACFFGIYFEVFFGAGAALAAAAFGALASSPVDIKDPRARYGAHGVSASIALSLGVGAVMIAANTFYKPTQADPNVILLAGQWVAMAAAMASMAGAATVAGWGKNHRFAPAGLGMLVATMAVAALLQATLRADIPINEYVVPLSSEGAHVRWALPGITGGAKGFGFEVTQVVPGAARHRSWRARQVARRKDGFLGMAGDRSERRGDARRGAQGGLRAEVARCCLLLRTRQVARWSARHPRSRALDGELR